MLLPWALGFVGYQMINPGSLGWWSSQWGRFDGWVHFTPTGWMSASLISFAVAAVVTVPTGLIARRRR
jgi:hypothetical protein